MAARYGAETSVLDLRDRLVCSGCGSRQVEDAFAQVTAVARDLAAPNFGPIIRSDASSQAGA
jgi:hypothetical protein